MTEELRTPDEEPKLLAAEHGGFFFVYRDAPKVELGRVDRATVSLIYDGNSKPCLTVDLEGHRAIVDVGSATVAKGVLRQDVMARVLEYAAENREALADIWAEFHDHEREMRQEIETIASELTDPNDPEFDDSDNFDDEDSLCST